MARVYLTWVDDRPVITSYMRWQDSLLFANVGYARRAVKARMKREAIVPTWTIRYQLKCPFGMTRCRTIEVTAISRRKAERYFDNLCSRLHGSQSQGLELWQHEIAINRVRILSCKTRSPMANNQVRLTAEV